MRGSTEPGSYYNTALKYQPGPIRTTTVLRYQFYRKQEQGT